MSGTLARAVLALYPPSWRARYRDEVLMLVEDSGGRPRDVASVAWRALPAWFCSPRYLRDRSARVRASLSTALMAWSMLAGLALVFAQLIQFQGVTAPGYPVVGWAYAAFDIALAVSALVAGLGSLPLWLLMFRRAWREQRVRDLAYLLLPLLAPATYVGWLAVTTQLVGGQQGVGPYWFLVITLAGFGAAAVAAAGPGLALRRLRPRGPALRLAATAAGISAAAMAVAAAAIVVAIAGLCQYSRHLDGRFSPIFVFYLVPLILATAVTTVSAARAARAARAGV
ncbi:MAG TPA: hypothetical protein VFV73_30070 [Streptosporangiaceae bacterium]|nr:hypothetical protein [Streptosporangiaceae bacterium]